jgi:SNF2 family DNA or RNA helicase
MPPFIPPDYIDNTPNRLLYHVLNHIIEDYGQSELAIASGYFEPDVWELVGQSFPKLANFRLLLGRQPEIELPTNDLINLKKYYKQKLKGVLETSTFNREQVQRVEDLITFLERDATAVRLYQGQFLHAKAYIFPQFAVVGSSNFTPSGLRHSSELDMVAKSEAIARDLRDNWFEKKWAQGADFKPDLIAALEASKFGSKPWRPYDVFIKVLYEYFKERLAPHDSGEGSGLDLAAFQQEGLHEAIRLLDLHNGVIVADAVGLGKTFIGLGLLENYLINKRRKGNIPRGLVVCPAQLRSTVWEPKLQEYQVQAQILSMEELGRKDFNWRAYRNFDFVLVDESHNFRNPGTGRYRNLFRLVSTGKRTKKVALLTATPINNTLWDLYHQLMLVTKGQEDHYRDFGIGNLRGFFARVDKGGAELFNLLEECMVRRSRQDIKKRQEAGEKVIIAGREVKFPQRRLAAITYDLDGTYAGFYDQIAADIEKLTLVAYNIEQFRKTAQEKTVVDRNNALIGILKTLFLKRLESSLAAFEASVVWQQEFQRTFYDFLVKKNRLLDSATYRKLATLVGGSAGFEDDETDTGAAASKFDGNGAVAALVEELPVVAAKDYDTAKLKTYLEADLAVFDGLIERLNKIRQAEATGQIHDDKLERVKQMLADTLPASTVTAAGAGVGTYTGMVAGNKRKILIFSYYAQTARYLYESLMADATWQGQAGQPRLALLTGRNSPAERKQIIRRFAPIANSDVILADAGLGELSASAAETAEQKQEEEIDILISTDVLSEGQNLQDAGVLLNYDLHWNPVRMIQRAGRIDRVGSPHPELFIYNCFPEAELERLLGLVGRLQKRIADIGRNIGNDASILGEVVAEKSLEEIKRLKASDRSVLQELEEEEAALLSADEMRLPLVAYLQELGEEIVGEIPLGIHSGRGDQPITGVFFAFRARDRHFWRFYEVERGMLKGAALTDKRRLFRLLQCSPKEARVVPKHQIWSYLETATRDILAELRQQAGSRRLRMPMSGLNLRLYNTLADIRQSQNGLESAGATSADAATGQTLESIAATGAGASETEGVTSRLMSTLQEISLKPFERDAELRNVLDSFQREKNPEVLLTELDAFAVEHELYEGVSGISRSTLTFEDIKEEDLELICYELFS